MKQSLRWTPRIIETKMTEKHREEIIGEEHGKVEDDLERTGKEGSRLYGVAEHCRRPLFLDELKAKKKQKKFTFHVLIL